MRRIEFKIMGIPFSKQSVRFGAVYGRDGKPVMKNGRVLTRKYKSKKVEKKEEAVTLQVLNQLPDGFVPFQNEVHVVKCHFVFPPLKSFSKNKMKKIQDGEIIYKNTTPDITDNLFKGVIDAMQGVVFVNDSRIVSMNDVKKYYGMVPRIEIIFEGS